MRKNLMILCAFICSFYKVFVIQNCWNWSVVPILDLNPATYWQIFGINLLLALLQNDKTEFRLEKMILMLNFCVPEDKKNELMAKLKFRDDDLPSEIFGMISKELLGSTFILGSSWTIYSFL